MGEILSLVPKERVSPTPPSERKAMFWGMVGCCLLMICLCVLNFLGVGEFVFVWGVNLCLFGVIIGCVFVEIVGVVDF